MAKTNQPVTSLSMETASPLSSEHLDKRLRDFGSSSSSSSNSSTSSSSVKSSGSVASDTLDDPPSVEEDADGYNVAAHLEHLIANLTSESSDSAAADWTEEHQEPQFDLNVDRSTDDCSNHSKWRARKLFDARLLGNDEKVYSGTRFKSMLRRIIPEQVPISNSRPTALVAKHVEKYNCGTCHILKLYIVFTLACSIFLCTLLDPCFRMSVFTFKKSSVPPRVHNNPENVSVAPNNDTRYFETFYGSDTNSRQELQSLESSVDDSNTENLQNCFFKKAYIISMFFCLPIYLFIFVVYSCHFVIRYQHFAWLLLESILLFISSLLLSILAFLAFDLANDYKLINLIVLTDGIIGFIIAFFTFWKYALSYCQQAFKFFGNN